MTAVFNFHSTHTPYSVEPLLTHSPSLQLSQENILTALNRFRYTTAGEKIQRNLSKLKTHFNSNKNIKIGIFTPVGDHWYRIYKARVFIPDSWMFERQSKQYKRKG